VRPRAATGRPGRPGRRRGLGPRWARRARSRDLLTVSWWENPAVGRIHPDPRRRSRREPYQFAHPARSGTLRV